MTSRPAFVQGEYYHLYNRGAHRQSLFREPENYLFALRRLKEYAQALTVVPVAYCLMPNHYHLLIRQDGDEPAGLLPQRVFNSYTKAYNHRYGHSGTLFEGHYRALRVDREGWLLHLCRYVHANPVKDGLVRDRADWPYSNYLEWVQERQGTLVDRALVSAHFACAQAYRDFVADYLATRRMPDGLATYLRNLESGAPHPRCAPPQVHPTSKVGCTFSTFTDRTHTTKRRILT